MIKPLLTQSPGPKCEALDVRADENVMVVVKFQTEILGVDVDEFVHGPIVGLRLPYICFVHPRGRLVGRPMLHVIQHRVNNNSAVILHGRQSYKSRPRCVLSVHSCLQGIAYIMSFSHPFVSVLLRKGESFVLTLWRVALQNGHVLLATIYQLST